MLIKQIAITVYLAHVGCFVPCDTAIIGNFKQIFSLFPEKESNIGGLSFFSKQICKLSRICRFIGPDAIFFIDEF